VIIRDIGAASTTVFRAKLRSLANVGVVAGSLLASAILYWDTDRAAGIGLYLNGASCLACAAIVVVGVQAARAPVVPSKDATAAPRGAVRDWRLLAFHVASALFSVVMPVLTFALPLWLTDYLRPEMSWALGALIATNAVVVVATQVAVGRWSDRQASPLPVLAGAGGFLCVGLAVLAVSYYAWGSGALALVWGSVVALSLGEVFFAAGSTEVLFSPRYAGRVATTSTHFNFATGVGEAVGPLVLAAVCLRQSGAGWLACASGFALLTAAIVATGRFRQRRNTREHSHLHSDVTDTSSGRGASHA